MRISDQGRLTNRQNYLSSAAGHAFDVENRLATGKRINKMSDDPGGATLVVGYRNTIVFETQMRRNISSGLSFIQASEAALSSGTDAMQRIRELAVQASSGTLGAQERQLIALEVDQLIGQLAQVANTNFAGAYVFAGSKSNAAAYQVTGNPPTAVTYQGDAIPRNRRISREDTIAINTTGGQVFGNTFTDLIALRDDLASGAPPTTIATHLITIDAASQRILDSRADLGARANRMDAALSVSERSDTDLQGLRASIEEIDLPATIVEFQNAQRSYEAALGAIGRTSDMTLLNFLR